ncbi:HNH endonuclease [Sphingobacterium siyangense]|uniref:HNH endonuclease n=1 Tax=Sphingobacterium siyangense TaxID=459529 RepID=UPI003DA67FEA
MWKAKLPSIENAIGYVKTAMTYKDSSMKYDISEQEITTLESFYDNYELLRGVPSPEIECDNLDDLFKVALMDTYGEVQIKGRLADLRDSLLLGSDVCPCCGISPPDELDHHLPISRYQVFAVYPRNLVPICHKCNNKKRAITGIDPNERFIHVYFNQLPDDKQFLFAEVELLENSINVSIEVRFIPELSELLFNQLQFQVRRIQLNERLSKEINIYLSSYAISLKQTFESGGLEAVQSFLRHTAEYLKVQFGFNNWRPVLIECLSNNSAFCNGGFYGPLSL